MHCEEVRNQLAEHVIEGLDPLDRESVEEHLVSCQSCREEAEGLGWVWSQLGALPTEKPDSEEMRARFDMMIEAHGRDGNETPSPSGWENVNSWFGRWWPRQPVLQFGFALVLLVVGIAIGQYFRISSEQQQDLSQLRAELEETRQLAVLSLMQQQAASERLRGLSWSNRIDGPGNEMLVALIDTLVLDPNVNVRLAAVDALKKFGENQVVRQGTLRALMEEESPLVQAALIGFMVELEQRESMDTLRVFSEDTTLNDGVRLRASWGLEQLQ